MEQAYDKLLHLYKTNTSQFESERIKIREKVKTEKHLFKYEELVPYPDYDDPDFNKTIFYKKEFNKSKSVLNKNSCLANDFELSNNQKFIKNFLSPFTNYNGLLLFHGVGVGKTCTAISIAERFFDVYQKKVLVVLSPNIKDNFKKQIFDINKYDRVNDRSYLCTGTTYTDMVLDKTILKDEDIEKKINKIISERYQFIGYKELSNRIDKIEETIVNTENNPAKHEALFKQKVDEMFSDRLIIIDEAHNLRVPTENGNKQIYAAFMNLLKLTKNVKLVLMTATPMYDDANEIISMLNLLLLNDKREPLEGAAIFDKTGYVTVSGKKQLIESCRGYVSYMRGQNPYIFPARLYPDINDDKNVISEFPTFDFRGNKIPESQSIKSLKLVGSPMSKYQRQIYNIVAKIDELKSKSNSNSNSDYDDDVEEEVEVGSNKDMQIVSQVSNLAYPSLKDPKILFNTKKEKLYSKQFDDCFDYHSNSKALKVTYNKDIKTKFGEFLSYKHIAEYAPKIKKILDYVQNSKGVVFIHSQFYYSGLIPLALALEHIGFTKYNSENLGQNFSVDNKFKGKRPSYIILSKKKEISPNNDAEIAAIKDKANANGENIKVVIVSKIGTEGIDFKRIREVHILEPWFNMSRIEQIIGRAVRTCSHIDLPLEERNVTIYLHASEYDKDKESIDLRMYRIAENKETRVKAVEKVLQENAIDCGFNKEVLSFPKKKVNITMDLRTSQGKVIKNYQLGDDKEDSLACNPDVDDKNQLIDESTFHRVFIVDDIMVYKKYISGLFSLKKSYTYEELVRSIKDSYKLIDEEIFSYALEEMINDRYKIYDTKKKQGYLIYRSNLYIFQYSEINDMRLTLEEREELVTVPKHSRLNISDMKEPPKEEKIKTRLRSNDKRDAKDTSDKSLITQLITQRVAQLEQTYQPLFEAIKTPSKTIRRLCYDYIVDRLSSSEFISCIEYIVKKLNDEEEISEPEKYIYNSLKSNDLLLFDDDDKIIYIYNYFEEDLFCLREDGGFSRCTPLDISKIKNYTKIMDAKKKSKVAGESTQGLLERKGADIKFKLKGSNSKKGEVCNTKLIDALKAKVKELSPDMHDKMDMLTKGGTKASLCILIELLLRQKAKAEFIRSV